MKIRHYIFYWFGIASLLIFFFLFSMAFTSTTDFCKYCHIMAKPHAAWNNAAHNKINCELCHMPEDYPGQILSKMDSLKRIPQIWFGDPKLTYDPNVVDDEKCQECHSTGYMNLVVNGIAINHRFHTKFKHVTCAECHHQTAHKDDDYSTRERMKFCVDCHKKNKASTKCKQCHVNMETEDKA